MVFRVPGGGLYVSIKRDCGAVMFPELDAFVETKTRQDTSLSLSPRVWQPSKHLWLQVKGHLYKRISLGFTNVK